MQKTTQNRANSLLNITFVISVLAFLLFSGCVTLEMRQKISPDGTVSGNMSMRADMNSLYVLMNITPDQYALADTQMKDSVCNASAFEAQNLNNVKCDVKNAILTISADVKSEKLNDTVFSKKSGLPYTEYWYTPSAVALERSLPTSQLQQIQGMQSLGSNMTLIIEMPGDIYETNGKIVGKAVVFDLLDLLVKETTPSIKSRELNFIGLSIVGGIVLLIIVGAYILIMRKPASKQ
jgi:hypothetical protein